MSFDDQKLSDSRYFADWRLPANQPLDFEFSFRGF